MGVHRYKLKGVSEYRLQREVETGLSLSGPNCFVCVDVTLVDDGLLTDLDDVMILMGYEFVESSPGGSPDFGMVSPETGTALLNASDSNPAVTDDNTKGLKTGSIWVNATSGAIFVCKDSSTGAAVWGDSSIPSGAAGGDLGGTYPNPTVDDGADSTAIHDNVAAEISAVTEKVTPVSADLLLIEDSAASNAKKRVQIGNLPGGGSVLQLDDFDANTATFPASSPAAATSRNEHPLIAYDDATAENVVFNSLMSKDYSDGNFTVDIDWVAASATTGDVVWGLEVERIAAGGHDIDSDSFAAQQTGTSTTNATSGIVTRTSIVLTQAQADAITAGDAFRLRVQRVAADAGDTMVGDAQLLRVSMRQ